MNKVPSPGRPRLLVVSSTFPRWIGDGEPAFVQNLCLNLANDFDITVLAPHTSGAAKTETQGPLRIVRFSYAWPEALQSLAYQGGIMGNLRKRPWRLCLVPLFILAETRALLCLLRRGSVDVIHAHWLVPQGVAVILARLAYKGNFPPVLLSAHGSDLSLVSKRLFRRFAQPIINGGSAVSVVSQAMAQRLEALVGPVPSLHVLPMPVDLRGRFMPAPNGCRSPCELLYVGRLVQEKGGVELIRALQRVVGFFPSVTLRVVGDGPLRKTLECLAQDLGLQTKVTFMGAVANERLPLLYQTASVFVAPSFSEGFGLGVLEAMACECPVVASDLPALRELIVSGENGLLVRPGDVAALVDAICLLLGDEVLREKLGVVARKYALANFDGESVTQGYVEALRRIMRQE